MITMKHTGVPVKAMSLDVVGYLGRDKFVLLKPATHEGRMFPMPVKTGPIESVLECTIEDGQVVYFANFEAVVLNKVHGKWLYRFYGAGDGSQPLPPNTFFEIVAND